MGPLKCSERPRECWGPFGVVGAVVYNIAGIEQLESRVQVTILLLILLAATYFLFMAVEAAFIYKSLCISKIVEVHLDILVDLLVVLAVMFNAVAPSSALEGLPVVAVLVREATWAAIGSLHG